MYSDVIKPLERKIQKLVNKPNPTRKDVDALEILIARHYYHVAMAIQSVHFVCDGERLQ